MANNLHISYDLKNPGRDYDKVIGAIQKLGGWAKIQFSHWYVDSTFTAAQARDYLKDFVDTNDSIYVVDSTNNDWASWNLSPEVTAFLHSKWFAKAA